MRKRFKVLPIVAGTTALAAMLVILQAGCGKQSQQPTGGSAPSHVADSGSKSAAKTGFDEVTSHLDAGGSLYGYLSTGQWLRGLSTNVAAWQEIALSLPELSPEQKEQASMGMMLATNLILHSGIEGISGVGLSGIEVEPGLYQTKLFVQRSPGTTSGYLWSIAGSAPHALSELDWLPAHTALAAFGDFDLAAVWSALKAETEKAQIPGIEGFARLEQQVEQTTGKKLIDLLSSLGGQQGIVVTLNPGKIIQLPIPNGEPIEMPEPALLISIKVKDDLLFDLIDGAIKKAPNIVRTEENGVRARSMVVPLGLPLTLKPTIARWGDYLFIASNDELLKAIVATKAGKQPGLKKTDEFKWLAKDMPTDGNQFSFMSKQFGETIKQLQTTAMKFATQADAGKEPMVELIQKLFQSGTPSARYLVASNTKEGWYLIGRGSQEPANFALMPAKGAVLAALALPALAKNKEKAQTVACVNNLKQIGLASLMWAAEHGNRFPTSFQVLTNELASPGVLICPADKKVADLRTLTWATLNPSTISYEFVSPGVKTDSPDTATTVLVRCPIHFNTCMADGSVRQNP